MRKKEKYDANKVKKIAFIVYSLDMGGAERVVSELANHFCKKNIDVSIVLVAFDTIKFRLCENINIVHLSKKITHSKLPINTLSKLFWIRKTIRKINPDIVISFVTSLNIFTCTALFLTKYHVISSERTDPRRFYKRTMIKIARYITYNFLSDGIVFQSKGAMNFFNKRIQNKSIIIGNPIKEGLPAPYEGERKKRIVAVGRLVKIKNYELLINAFSKFSKDNREYTLEIYGQGEEKERLENLTEELKLAEKIIFKGVASDVHAQIKDASLYVLTSNMEGMPNALMEAMAIGLPCVSSDCNNGSPKDFIEHGENGMLFSAGNEEEFLDCMNAVLSDKTLSNKILHNATIVAEKYSLETIGQQWISYISKVSQI